MKSMFGNASLLSILTIVSRFLGLARDMLFFIAFGASLCGEAFILAFTLPNLFRRMLGEGTLSSVFIPVYTQTLHSNSKEKAFGLLSKLLTRLLIFLLALSFLVCIVSYFLSVPESFLDEKWSFAASLNSISFSYVALICGAAIAIGALNGHQRFIAGGFSPIVLNILMITTLIIWGIWKPSSPEFLASALCFSVLIAGIVQFALPLKELSSKFNWKFCFDLGPSPELNQIKQLFWIGAFGAAVSQINILVSRFLAFSLDETGSLSYLFLSSRLVELPLGVFAVSISTVLFPELAKAVNLSDRKQFSESLLKGLRLTIAATVPAAIGLITLATPILSVFFNWGEFGESDVLIATQILAISACGLPFVGFSAFLIKAFHSEKNMTSPLRAAMVSMVLNLILSLVLMQSYGVHGLASANLIAAIGQSCYLYFAHPDLKKSFITMLRSLCFPSILISGTLMGLLVYFLKDSILPSDTKTDELFLLIILIPLGCAAYFISLASFGFQEIKDLIFKLKKNR